MKTRYKSLSSLLLFSLVFILYACPLGLDYAIGTPGTEKIDPVLIGTWKLKDQADVEVLEVMFAKQNSTAYAVTVLEKGEMYSLGTTELTGWTTTINGKNFLYVKPADEEKYYHYCYSFDNKNTLRIHDVSLLDGGVDAVQSTESLRTQVANSIGKEGWGAEQFVYSRE